MNKHGTDFLRLLGDVARLIRTEADRRARQFGMTKAQWSILARVSAKPGLSQRELAEYLDVEPITVARLVDRLEAGGFVERRADQGDRRVWRLHLLEAATPLLARFEHEFDLITALFTDGIDPDQLEQVMAVLQRMKGNVQACRRAGVAPDDIRESA